MATDISQYLKEVDSIVKGDSSLPSQESTTYEKDEELSPYFSEVDKITQGEEYTTTTKEPTEVKVDETLTTDSLDKNEVWLDSAKKIYEDETGKTFDPDEAGYDNISEWFKNRHSQYNWNLVNMLDTGFSVGDKSDEVKKAWLESMDLYDQSDGDAGDFFRAMKNLALDPTTIASIVATFGVGGLAKMGGQKAASLAAKVSFKENLRKELKGKVSKETIEEVLKTKGSKDILAETLKTARNRAAAKTMGYKAIPAVPTGAAYMGAADVAMQEMAINAQTPETIAEQYGISLEEGAQKLQELKDEGYDLKRLALMAGLGGVTGFALGSLPSYVGGKLGMARALGKSKEGAEDLVDIQYSPKDSPHLSIRETMPRAKLNALYETGDIEIIQFKNVKEIIPPSSRNNINVDSEQILERVTPGGRVAQTLRRKITEVLGETGARRLGKINTLLGRAITSTAALPSYLARSARRRSNVVRSADVKIEAAIKGLKDIQKKENVSTDAIRKFINENDDSLLRTETDKTETLTKLEEIKKSIFENQEAINTNLGKKTDDELLEEAKKRLEDPRFRGVTGLDIGQLDKVFKDLRRKENKIGVAFNEDGGYYFRTFEASHNPKYLKEIEKALSDRGVAKADFITKVDDFRSFITKQDAFKNMPSEELDAHILTLVQRLSKDDTTIFDEPSLLIKEIFGDSVKTNSAKIGKRKELDDSILNLLGEVTDPFEKLTKTLTKQNKILGEVEYLSDVNKFFENILAKNSDVNLELGGLVNAIPTHKATIKRTEFPRAINLRELYKKVLSDTQYRTLTKDSDNVLKDIWVSPEMSKLIEDGVDNIFPQGGGSAIWRGIQQAAAFGQSTQTILDLPAYAINAYGAVQNLIASGYLLNPAAWGAMRKSLRAMRKGIRSEDPEVMEKVARLKRDGVIDSDLTSEMIIKNINLNDGDKTGPFAIRGYKKGMEALSRWYGSPDTYAKLIAHEAETEALKKMFPKKTADEIFDMASDRVINTMPTYGVASPAARYLGRMPIGTYALFPSEMLRTTKNIVSLAVKDTYQGISTGNKAQAIHGMRKLAGLGAMGAGIDAYVNTNNEVLGVDKDTQRGLEAMAPDWGKGGNPYFLDGLVEDDQGRIITRNVRSSNFDAQDYLKVPLRLMTAKILAGENVTDAEISDAFKGMTNSILGPYTNMKFLHEALLNVVTGVDMETGRRIYSNMPGDEGLSTENVKRGILELAESIVPGTIEPLIKYMESSEAAKATKDGLGVSSSGFPLRANDIAVWASSGIRPSTIDVKRSMRFALSKDIRSMSQSQKEFKNFIRTMPVKDYSRPENKQELLDIYRRYQEQKLLASKKLADKIGLYKNISYTDSDGKRRKFGLEQVIMAATDDGYYERGRDVEAIALANAELDNYRRGIFLPDELNTSRDFIKMLTDKGVPLSILNDLANINQEFYSRVDEGLVNMNIGGYIGDFFKNLLGVSPLNVGEEEQLKIALEQGQMPTAPLPKVKPKLEDDNKLVSSDDSDLDLLIGKHLDRLDVKQEDRNEARKNLNDFAKRTRDTESAGFGGYTAVNQPVGDKEATTAKGAYQFVEGSIVPALNRLKKYIGEKDWMTKAREHKDIFKLTPKQQDLLFYGDILDKTVGKEKGRGDKYLKKIIKGDKKAMFDLYKEGHHTGELSEEAYRNAMTKFLKGN
tara:strand:+ start:4197 stop:9224 length:5028 start_codon:yes stop_codon:yes gene_type:complete